MERHCCCSSNDNPHHTQNQEMISAKKPKDVAKMLEDEMNTVRTTRACVSRQSLVLPLPLILVSIINHFVISLYPPVFPCFGSVPRSQTPTALRQQLPPTLGVRYVLEPRVWQLFCTSNSQTHLFLLLFVWWRRARASSLSTSCSASTSSPPLLSGR